MRDPDKVVHVLLSREGQDFAYPRSILEDVDGEVGDWTLIPLVGPNKASKVQKVLFYNNRVIYRRLIGTVSGRTITTWSNRGRLVGRLVRLTSYPISPTMSRPTGSVVSVPPFLFVVRTGRGGGPFSRRQRGLYRREAAYCVP